ncbi:hypothetical protein RclHR1_21030003 [Rhizophagus clarus]|uniref:Uncharacterized protein n=1 Tax=Rhizophagus clarus TaxID=94130 RepID=A0A2Z6R7Z9_9GLOM|nr:hypothetical protein RclHR1_21030003 [Rhizophagus clarus]
MFSVTSLKVDYFVSNKAKLCQGYLIKCENFNNQVSESERIEILAQSIPEDIKKVAKKQKIDKEKNLNITDKSDTESKEEEKEEKKDEDVVKLSKLPITTQSHIGL